MAFYQGLVLRDKKKSIYFVLTLLISVLLMSACASSKSIQAPVGSLQNTPALTDVTAELPEERGMRVKSETLVMPEQDISLTDAVGGENGIYFYGLDRDRHASFYSLDPETLEIESLSGFGTSAEDIAVAPDGTLRVLSLNEQGQYEILGGAETVYPDPAIYQNDYISDFLLVGENYLFLTDSRLYAADGEGSLLRDLGDYRRGAELLPLPGGGFLYIQYGGSQNEQDTVQSNSPTQIVEFDAALNQLGSYTTGTKFVRFYPWEGDAILASLGQVLYAYDYKTGACTAEINVLTSGLETKGLIRLDGERIFSIQRGQPTIWTTVEDGEVETLTLAVYEPDPSLQLAVEFFNAANPHYVIEIRDYADYDEYGADMGLTRMGADIVSGQAPDLYELSDFSARQLAQRGLLQDIKPFFKNDPDLDYGDLIPNAVRLMEYKGGLYEFVPAFRLVTMFGDRSVVGTSWTAEDFFRLAEELPPSALVGSTITKEDFLNCVLCFMKEELYSEETQSCHFDTETFARMLEFAARLPEEVVLDGSRESTLYAAYYGKQKAGLGEFGSVVVSEISWYDKVFGGEAQFVGFPTNTGSGVTLLPEMRLGMSSSSTRQNGVWEFYKFLLQKDNQSRLYGCFPIRSDMLDWCLENWAAFARENLPGVTGCSPNGDIHIKPDSIRPDMEDFIRGLVTRADCLCPCDREVLDIVMDSAGAFFSGDKSAEDAAALIQSRVGLYLAEQYG